MRCLKCGSPYCANDCDLPTDAEIEREANKSDWEIGFEQWIRDGGTLD